MSNLIKALAHWRLNPVAAVQDWFGVTPEDYQCQILLDLFGPRAGNRASVKSAHGVGKTSTEAWAAWIYLITRANSRVVATAPTQSQLKDILWPEAAKWHQRMPAELASQWEISETHIRSKEFPKTWFATARTSNKPENLQGFHGDNILVLVDEASGVPQNVFEVIEGILTSADEGGLEAKLLMAGNPTQTSGEFYNSFHRNKELYRRFTISGEKTKPKDKNGGKIYTSKRVSEAYRQTMARKYGLTSAVYDVRVRGLFPLSADDVVIPLQWAEAAQHWGRPVFDPVADPITLSMDVSRFGGDETVLGTFRRGHLVQMQTWPKTSTNECVDILNDAYKYSKVPVIRVIVDEPGVGGGVVDGARRAGVPITAYNGGAGLSVETGDPEDDVRMFANRRSRDWWNVRRILEAGATSFIEDETLVNQLASVKYKYNAREKIQVETKGDMRDRLGDDASPDRADMVVMGLAPFYSLINAIPLEILDAVNGIMYGSDRPTADMDF
jgi:phage terminase large subunit